MPRDAKQVGLPPLHRNFARALKRDYYDNDPSTRMFLRAWSFGYAAETGPAYIRLLVAAIFNARRKSAAQTLSSLVRRFIGISKRGFRRNGLAMFFAVALCGAKECEKIIYRILLMVYSKVRHEDDEQDLKNGIYLGHKQQREGQLRRISTFLATSVSAFVAFGLQSRNTSQDDSLSNLPLVAFPSSAGPTVTGTPDATYSTGSGFRYESSTMNLTLFLLVRAIDTTLREVYAKTSFGTNRLVKLFAKDGNTLLFVLSSWRIMWVWFYKPWLLPPSFNKWIHSMAQIDQSLLQLLRSARSGEWVYGKVPATATLKELGPTLCRDVGYDEHLGMPDQVAAFPCAVAHGLIGNTPYCEINLIKRWTYAFFKGMILYTPVHFLPLLLFSSNKVKRRPLKMLTQGLLGTSRSSAFIASFVAGAWGGVCIGRTRLGPKLIADQQFWDGGAAMMLGTFLCGFSILLENKRRRGEMALFVAPRALYAILDDVLPYSILTNDKLAALVERFVFSLSSAVIVTSAVYDPQHIRGIVRSIARLLTKDWYRDIDFPTLH